VYFPSENKIEIFQSLTGKSPITENFGSIGIGTVISALLVGNEVKILSKRFKTPLNKAMGLENH